MYCETGCAFAHFGAIQLFLDRMELKMRWYSLIRNVVEVYTEVSLETNTDRSKKWILTVYCDRFDHFELFTEKKPKCGEFFPDQETCFLSVLGHAD